MEKKYPRSPPLGSFKQPAVLLLRCMKTASGKNLLFFMSHSKTWWSDWNSAESIRVRIGTKHWRPTFPSRLKKVYTLPARSSEPGPCSIDAWEKDDGASYSSSHPI